MTASIINKTFKSIVAASAALIMAASVAACGPSAATPSDEGSTGSDSSSSSSATARTLDEIKKSGKLKVAVFSDKAPFGYVDKDGNYAGYDVYFAERLGKDLGVDVEYTSVDAAARVDVLTSNKVDITLANFTVTDERKEKVDFAKPYMKVALGVVSPENAEITDVDQLKGNLLREKLPRHQAAEVRPVRRCLQRAARRPWRRLLHRQHRGARMGQVQQGLQGRYHRTGR